MVVSLGSHACSLGSPVYLYIAGKKSDPPTKSSLPPPHLHLPSGDSSGNEDLGGSLGKIDVSDLINVFMSC